jgi:hypothetical protein
VLDDYSRYILAWTLRTSMGATDVMETLDLARAAGGVERVPVVHRPRLLSDNGPCSLSGELATYLEANGLAHTRSARYHPMTQRKSNDYSLFKCSDRPGEITRFGADNKQRAKQKIHRDRRITGLHLRDPGLAGFQLPCELNLRPSPSRTPGFQVSTQRQPQLNQGGFSIGQVQKILHRADSPAMSLEFVTLRLPHRFFSRPTAVSYSFRRRLQDSITVFGVSRDFLSNTSRITTSVAVQPIHDPPRRIRILNPQLVTSTADRRHRPRMGHPNVSAFLNLPQQYAGLNTGLLRERWGFHYTGKPDERFTPSQHSDGDMSYLT